MRKCGQGHKWRNIKHGITLDMFSVEENTSSWHMAGDVTCNLCCEDDYGAEQDKVHERERARRPWLVPPMGELALDNK